MPGRGDGMPFESNRAEIAPHPRRGRFPQRNREGTLPFRRLGQVRRRRRGMRGEDEADEQLLPVPQALLRIAQGHQVLQAGSIRELLPIPWEPHQEARAEGHDRYPLQQGLRDAEKRPFGEAIPKNLERT